MSETLSSSEDALEAFLERRRRGEAVDPAAFAALHGELGSDLAHALDALIALERATGDPVESTPERIGPFRVVREIGRGGMGVVLEAIEEPLERRVALKVLPSELLLSASARSRFKREAELAARLDHPGIATIFGAGVAADRPWIAMRYVAGRTLRGAIAEARAANARCIRLPTSERGAAKSALGVAACLARVARALQSAHEQGVVHRDVKPSNVVVTPEGLPVLLDFGLAITEESDGPSLTRTGDTAGTPAYLAPEIVAGERPRPDAQTDVYALGVTLYECLTLSRPFDAPTPVALYRAIVAGVTPDVRAANRDVPRDLGVVVATALERDRARRYGSAAALAADLEACVAGRPIAARPVPLLGRALRWARREPRQAVLAGLLFVATLGAASFGGTWWASRDEVHAAETAARESALESALGDGFALIGSGRVAEAEAAFARALAHDPRNLEARVGRVFGALLGSREEVEARLREVPEDAGAIIDDLRALVADRALPPARVEDAFRGASALELFVRGLCLQYEGNRAPPSASPALAARAFACFTEAILRAPAARSLYHEQRAFATRRLADERAARSSAEALLRLWPDSTRALYAAGSALYVHDPAAARRALEAAVALEPQHGDAYQVLAIACFRTGDGEAAEHAAWRGLALDPRSAGLHFWVGESLRIRGCADEARAAHARAAALDPSHAGIWEQLGSDALEAGDYASAIEGYDRSLVLDPREHRVRLLYSAALENAGDAASAGRERDIAFASFYPSTVEYWRAVVDALVELGAFDGARAAAEFGLALAPGDVELLARVQGVLAEGPR